MKSILPLSLFLLIHLTTFSQPDSTKDKLLSLVLTKEQMQQDYTFMRDILEKTHPALYRYTPKPAMQKKMDSIAGLLDKPMLFYDYYLLLTSLIADIRCAHTSIIPRDDLRAYYMKETVLLPFEMKPIDGKLYITVNGTMDSTIRPGDEIITINGKSAKTVFDRLYRYIWADGYIRSSKKAMLSGVQFGLFYYAMVERTDSFHLSLRDLKGKKKEVTVDALSYETIMSNFFKNPVNQDIINANKERNRKESEAGWRLEILKEPASTAYIRINGFGGGRNGKEAAEKMRGFMDKNMDTLKKENIKNLVIDVRNNGGGWDIQGVELLTYLVKDSTSFRYFRRKHSITDSNEYLKYSDLSPEDLKNVNKELIPEPDGTFTISEEYNDDMKIQYPKKNRFKGNVYILANGGSGSTTSEFTALAHSHRVGVFIGEETGGAYEGDNGGSFLHFVLPNSKIALGTPLLYYDNGVRPRKLKGRGVIPEYPIDFPIEDVLSGRDTYLELALELIKKGITIQTLKQIK